MGKSKDKIKVTEWIQTIGTIVAIISALIGFFTLFKKDIEKEKAIGNLSELAIESKHQTDTLGRILSEFKLQTEALEGQLDAMNKRNELIMHELNISKKQLENLEKSLATSNNILENSNKKHLIDIKPEFKIIDIKYVKDKYQGRFDFAIVLENVGETAKSVFIDAINFSEKKRYSFPMAGRSSSSVLKDAKHVLMYKSDEKFEFELIYKDIDGNLYIQYLSCRGLSPCPGDWRISMPYPSPSGYVPGMDLRRKTKNK